MSVAGKFARDLIFGVKAVDARPSIAPLSAYDIVAETARGTHEVEIYVANGFDCGGIGARRTYLGAFDVFYRGVE
ncbi:MAG: hypothetical protein AB8H79_19660 [Myxococcota bacterium]